MKHNKEYTLKLLKGTINLSYMRITELTGYSKLA